MKKLKKRESFKMMNILMMSCLLAMGGVKAVDPNHIYTDMIIDYFQTRNVSNIILFLCWPIQDRVQLVKRLSETGIRASNHYGQLDTRMRETFKADGFLLGMVFDVRCYVNNTPSFQKIIYFNASYVWLTLDYGLSDFIQNYSQILPMTIATDVILTKTSLLSENQSYTIELFDVYKIGSDSNLTFIYIGNWTKDDEESNRVWKSFVLTPKVNRRNDLNGLGIRAVTLTEHRPKDVHIQDYLEDEHFPYVDSVFRMNYRLVKLLREMYNFTINLILADNWTDKNSQGFYRSGNLIGLLAEKKGDILAGALQLMYDRLPLVDIVHMTYPFRAGFIFRFSGDFGNIKLNFLRPFDDNVWIIMLSVSTVIVASVWFILIFENKYFVRDTNTNFNIGDAILSVLTSWCQMGSGVRPSTYASRLVYLTLFLNSLILYNFYTSSIVSSLLNYRSQKFSIVDLADSPMKCGSVDVGYVHNLLFDVPIYPNMKYFNSKKKRDPFYFSVTDGIENVKRGGFAFHAEFNTMYSDVADTLEATEICELQEVDTISLVYLCIMTQKHSPYTEMFKVGLAKARQTGQLKRLLDIWVAKKPICQASKGVSEVNIYQTASVFFVLAFGQISAVLLLFYERRKWKRSHSRQVNAKINEKI